MTPLRKLFHSASYGKISTEPDPELLNGPVISVLLEEQYEGLLVKVYQSDGGTLRFIGKMELGGLTTPSTIVVVLEDGTKVVQWNRGKES